jgi:hypothetical protein
MRHSPLRPPTYPWQELLEFVEEGHEWVSAVLVGLNR